MQDQNVRLAEANWIEITTLGLPYDEEIDVNAAPGTSDLQRYRHRRHSFTDQQVDDWTPGPAPR